MNNNRGRLNKGTKIYIHIAYVENNTARINLYVFAEPAVEVLVCCFTGHKTENLAAGAKVNVFGLVLAGIANSAGFKTGNDFISYCKGLSVKVLCNVLTNLNYSTCSLVSEFNGNITEWVALVLMYVSSADTCLLDLYKNLIVTNFRNGKFKNLNLSFASENGNSCLLWNLIVCHSHLLNHNFY